MAVFTSSAFALRRKRIVEALRDCGATGPVTARALADTGLENPDMFAEYTRTLVEMGVVGKTEDGRYYAR